MGLGIGAALGGLALLVGTTAAFVTVFALDALTFAAAGMVLSRLPEPTPHATLVAAPGSGRRLAVLRDRPYVVTSVLNAVLYLYMPMLSVLLPLYLARATAAPAWSIGAVFVLNTTGVALLQVRVARRVVDLATAVVAIRRAGAALLLACVVFALAAHTTSLFIAVAVLAAAVLLQILGEVLLASGSWEIGFTLADPDHQGQWQGLFSSGIPLARALGPLALTSLVLTWSGPGWVILGLLFAGTAVLMGPVVVWASRVHTTPIQPSSGHELSQDSTPVGSLEPRTPAQLTKR